MPITNKPSFPNPSVQELKGDLDKLKTAVDQSKHTDGSVNVARLEQLADASGDRGLEYGVRTIKDAFVRVERREVTDGCGTSMQDVRTSPTTLEAGEVQSVMQALTEAKRKVGSLDSNHDGKISKDEAARSGNLAGLAGELADNIVDGSLTAYKAELHAWREALTDVHESVQSRKDLDQAISRRAEHHAETPMGAEAIRWAYRNMATRGSNASMDSWSIEDDLQDAETSFLRFIPLFGIARRAKTKEGHLSDKEVMKLFGTDDLAAFVADKQATVTGRVGDYETAYLAGKDVAGVDALKDPDFTPIDTGC